MLATPVETARRISRRLWLIAAVACTFAATAASGQEPADLLPNPVGGDYQIRGRTVGDADGTLLAGVNVRLFRAEGRVAPPVEVARVLSDADGRFEFLGLEAPRPHEPLDRLQYAVVAESEGRPPKVDPTVALHAGKTPPEVVIVLASDEGVLTGKVVDEQGRPVAGATVMQNSFLDHRAIPGVASATTDAEGRFTIERVPIWNKEANPVHAIVVRVVHPDYADALGAAPALPADIIVTMPTGCVVTGEVVDGLTGKPAAAVVATIELAAPLPRRNPKVAEAVAEKAVAVDAAGRFRVVVAEGRYNIRAESTDRVCAAVANRECPAGETVELSPMTMIEGGYILGRVLDSRTGQPVAATPDGEPITVGLFGPSHPRTAIVRAAPLATVDPTGRFLLAAAPGENFPYLVNHRGDRTVTNAVKHPPVVVAEGKTTKFDLLVSPKVLRFQANVPPVVRRKLAPLPKDPEQRIEQILRELQDRELPFADTEQWCSRLRDLVAAGPAAVPRLCQELDRTASNIMLRQLALVLRAIGDRRAVPALIRALPKCLQPAGSDMGMEVADADLLNFMQKHDLDENRGKGFGFGRPVREVFGALHALTGQNFDDAELFHIHRSEDPRRVVLQEQLFDRQARRWAEWWNANAKTLTDGAAYNSVDLPAWDRAPLPPPKELGPGAKLAEGSSGGVLSPGMEQGSHFLDLDTGYAPSWPKHIPRDARADADQPLAAWAAETGVDLMCIIHRDAGTETYVLRSFDAQAIEIGDDDQKKLEELVAAGSLPKGRAAGELLMHYDADAKRHVADANAAFVVTTREGNRFVVEAIDRVTRIEDLTGRVGDWPKGVGFQKGVRMSTKAIVP